MADRSVLVELRARVTQFQSGMATARQEVDRTRREITKAATEQKQAFDQVGMAAGAMGAAVAVGMAMAIRAATDFDKEMSAVKAVSGATATELDALREAAIRAGADTAFSAGQSAQAIAELTRAGVAVGDVLGGALAGSLDLAAAGGLDLANAAEIAAQALNIFDLQGSETTRVADALAAGANKSAADVSTLGDALRQGGLVASQYGLDLETTVGTLSLFADNALVGSDAGTSFKTMLQRLTPQSDEAAEAMDSIGFSAYDAQGNFVGLESVADQLRAGLSDLSDQERATALNTIFGADAVRAAAVLYEAGAEGVIEYTTAVSDQGAAAEMAATMLDNLAGDVEEFSGSVETALIDWGENLDGVLRSTVQFGTDVVNVLGSLPEPIQNVGLGLGGLVSTVGLATGGFLLAAPRIVETRKALDTLATSMPKTVDAARGVTSFLTGPWGVALAAAAAATLYWSRTLAEAREEARTTIAELKESAGSDPAAQLADLTDEVERLADQRNDVDSIVDRFLDFGGRLKQPLSDSRIEIEELNAEIERLERAAVGEWFSDLGDRVIASTTATDGWGNRLHELGVEIPGTTQAVADLTATFEGSAEALVEMVDPISAFDAALERNEATIKANAQAVADSTETNEDSWEDYAEEATASLGDVNASLLEQIAAQEDWADNLAIVAARVPAEFLPELDRIAQESPQLLAAMADASDEELEEFVRLTGARGTEAVDELTNALMLMPEIGATFGQRTATALTDALGAGVIGAADIAYAYTRALATGVNPLLIALGRAGIVAPQGPTGQTGYVGGPTLMNVGGRVPGTGPDRDTVPAVLTPGEFVMRRTAVDMYGPAAMEAINDGTAEIHYYNTGGFVSTDDVPAVPSVSHYSSWVGEPADATMDRAREATVEWLEENLAPKLGPGIGSAAMMAALRTRFPGLQLISGYRPGAITATGNRSYHAQDRAVDIPPRTDVNHWIYDNYKSETRELIASWAGARQVRNGRDHYYTGITRAMHFDHNHWAMQSGGFVPSQPGGVPARVGEGAHDEIVMPLGGQVLADVGQAIAAAILGVAGPIVLADSGPVVRSEAPGNFGRQPSPEVIANAELLRIEGLDPAERLAEVQAAMAAMTPYTDEWMELLREGQRLQADIARETQQAADETERLAQAAQAAADAARDAAEARARETQQVADGVAAELNRLLDRKAQLDAAAAKALADNARAVAAAQTAAAQEISSLLAGRASTLTAAFGGAANPFAVGWGNTAGALTSNVLDQVALFDEWADGLAELRSRGVSESMIETLGLDDPAEIGQVRLLLAATTDELAQLDAALALQRERAAQQAEEESTILLGALGRAVQEVRTELTATFDELRLDLTDQLAAIAAETAQLGLDTGRSYAEAMAEALASGLPGIIAVAEQYEAALEAAMDAAKALKKLQLQSTPGIHISETPGQGPPIIGPGGNWGAVLSGGVHTYDSGGVLPPGMTLARNLTGHNEYVFTGDQLRSMQAARSGPAIPSSVTVRIGEREFTGYVEAINDGYHRTNAVHRSMAGTSR